jgi:ATP adenylyltransferase
MEYLKGEAKSGCPFCELPKEEPSEQNLVLWRDENLFVIMNKFPYNVGHLMVVPRAHVGHPEKLDAKIWVQMSVALQLALEILKQDMDPQGFNMGMNLGVVGGAGIPGHIHWHVIPRWGGDTNFMPLIAETKALPTHNATVYRRLRPLFEDFASRLSAATMKI